MDWLKVETCLPTKPEVLRIGKTLGISPDAVCGMLIRFWAWVGNASVDGCVDHIGPTEVDRLMAYDGFTQALVSCGWLSVNPETGSMTLPNYERHCSESAKKRALKARYQANWRGRAVEQPVEQAVESSLVTKKLLEKRRINTLSASLPAGFPEFWEAYPRKCAKKNAVKAWVALNPDESLQARILKAVSGTKWPDEMRYIPHPSTWINGRRWDDEQTPPKKRGLVL